MKANSKLMPYFCHEPIMLALSLDKKKQVEHIIIGVESEIYTYLFAVRDAQLFYNQKRPLGTLLFEHEAQDEGVWNLHVHSLFGDALRSFLGRTKNEETAIAFLEKQLDSSDAVCKFTACKSLAAYKCYLTKLGNTESVAKYDEVATNLSHSFKKFILGPKSKSNVEETLKRTEQAMTLYAHSPDTVARILYPGKVRNTEWLLISESFFPAIRYYLQRIHDLGICFCTCSVCGRMYLAESLHHSLCSEACRIAQNRQKKREFDERARANGYDIEYKNTSQRIRNRLANLKKQDSVPEEVIQKSERMFVDFRREALRQKKNIITEADRKAFRDWMFNQERKFEQLCTSCAQ